MIRHSFYPFLRYEVTTRKISKKSGELSSRPKSRTISYASHVDSHIYAYYASLLSKQYESKLVITDANSSVIAFRQLGKSNADFAKSAFDAISRKSPCVVLAYDISGFFDNLDHRLIKKSWCDLLGVPRLPDDYFAIYKSITNHSSVDRERIYKHFGISPHNPKSGRRRICTPPQFREIKKDRALIERNISGKGIPQGSPISAIISNIYMFDFDMFSSKLVGGLGGIYYRYCDDMLFIVPVEKRAEVENEISVAIKDLGLEIQNEKTDIVTFSSDEASVYSDKPLQYLGFLFDGKRVLIRSAALARFSEKYKRGVSLARQTKRKRDKIRAGLGLPSRPIFKRELYQRYSHLGRRNFVRYGLNAAELFGSKHIRRQLKPLWKRLNEEIDS